MPLQEDKRFITLYREYCHEMRFGGITKADPSTACDDVCIREYLCLRVAKNSRYNRASNSLEVA